MQSSVAVVPKVVIIGAGPAGMRAAQTLVENGLKPLVIDEAPRSGGQIYRRPPDPIVRDARALYGFETRRAQSLHQAFDNLEQQIDYWPASIVWSAHDRELHVITKCGPRKVVWEHLVIASGAIDRVIPFNGWDLPGVYTLGGAQVALKYQACSIGERPIFFGTGPLLYLVAFQYAKAGVKVQAVLDTAPRGAKIRALPGLLRGGWTFWKGVYYTASLVSRGIPVRSAVRPISASSGSDGGIASFNWRDRRGREHRTLCDSLSFGFGLKSETQLADLCNVPFEFDNMQRQWLPKQDQEGRAGVQGIYFAGDGAGIRGAEAAELSGERAAHAVLYDLGHRTSKSKLAVLNRALTRLDRFRMALELVAFPFPTDIAVDAADQLMVCRCEGITAEALRRFSRSLGATEVNRAKAFSRVGMGRCQGRLCGPVAAEILADALGVPIDQVGRLRGQAPIKPVQMKLLADESAP